MNVVQHEARLLFSCPLSKHIRYETITLCHILYNAVLSINPTSDVPLYHVVLPPHFLIVMQSPDIQRQLGARLQHHAVQRKRRGH